ncbi:unnamed protein product, partial [Staurois parvus]
PKIHTRPLSEHAARQVRKGGGRASAPPLLNQTRPHALNMGGWGALGQGAPPKAPFPHVNGDKGLFR